jgi:hypothetical protein
LASQDRRLIAKELKGRKVGGPFRYFDRAAMAVVSKNYAGWNETGCAQAAF